MGHGFGELAKVRGIVTHKISSYEQKAFAGWWTKAIPNTLRRIRSQIFIVTPRNIRYGLPGVQLC
ncbi:AAEL005143-PA [Aedes aegypti]|uniref:Cytochrome b-c1 complex subunit 8 n=1 Tax=Aedes aegypti TaxID=7159 RepID=Q17AY5_AEDAE|nr:AAEL005143-PA [Aedes aegypti]